MKSVSLTITGIFFSNVLLANEKITSINQANTDHFWGLPVFIYGGLTAWLVIVLIVIVRATFNIEDLYPAKTSSKVIEPLKA
jgi:hypothetical protein